MISAMTTDYEIALHLCVSKQLRGLRKGAGRTQPQAADECGVSLATWQRWESGRRPHPSLNTDKLLSYVARLKAEAEPPV